MRRGWIKLWRKLSDNAWWRGKNHPQKVLAVTCLMLANHKPGKIMAGPNEIEIEPGQFWTSIDSLMDQTGLSIQNVRTSLTNLKKLKFLTYSSTEHGRLITILKWDTYQANENEPNNKDNKGLTDAQQTGNNKQECKNVKNDKKPKNKPNPEVKDFMGYWLSQYKIIFDSEYDITKGKDHAIIKGLLQTFELLELQRRTLAFMNDQEPWIVEQGHTIGIFKTKINKYKPVKPHPAADTSAFKWKEPING